MKCPKCGKEMTNNKCECGYSEPIKFTGFGETVDSNPQPKVETEFKPVIEDMDVPHPKKTQITAEEMLHKTEPSFVESNNPFTKQ
jgi:hypothetical protein